MRKSKDQKITVTLTRSFSESTYLIDSNKKRFREIAEKKEWRHGDTLDMLLSLHIVLEAGLNCIFRRLTLFKFKKDISETKIIKNIDNINFKDKLTLFIYNSSFNFDDKLSEATKHHEIIGKLREFTEVRNQIMHGHAIATVYVQNQPTHTDLRKKLLTNSALLAQISKFISIVDGVNFFVECLADKSVKSYISQSMQYILYDFIPNELLENARKV